MSLCAVAVVMFMCDIYLMLLIYFVILFFFFFFSSRRRHTRCSRDWSSDVCSSDLRVQQVHRAGGDGEAGGRRRGGPERDLSRSEERRVGKECRSRWSPDH